MTGGFLLYLPVGFEQGKWPLIVFLHGRGEAGSDVNWLRSRGLPRVLEKQPDFRFIVASPQLVAKESGEEHEAPTGRDQDAVDVDVVTTMLERLAKEGPRLSRPNLEADLAKFERSLRGRSAARA